MLRPVLAAFLFVLAAGCTGLPPGESPGRTATLTPTPVGSPASPTPSTTAADIHPGLTARVDVQAFQAPPVRIVATHVGTGRMVVNETYDGTFEASFDEASGAFEPDRSYRVRIRVDGEVAWNRTVRHYEGYELRIGEGGNVTVESHSVA